MYNMLYTDFVTYHRQQNILYPQRWQILRREFLALSRFMLCYPRLSPLHTLKTFSLLLAVNQSEDSSRNYFPNICNHRGKGYFAAVGTCYVNDDFVLYNLWVYEYNNNFLRHNYYLQNKYVFNKNKERWTKQCTRLYKWLCTSYSKPNIYF